MIVGNPSRFAIESEITGYVTNRFPGSAGYFVVHVAGETYCRKEEDVTDLPVSLNGVEQLLHGRGRVRLIAFRSDSDALVKEGSLRELMLGGDEFYGVCDQCDNSFAKSGKPLEDAKNQAVIDRSPKASTIDPCTCIETTWWREFATWLIR